MILSKVLECNHFERHWPHPIYSANSLNRLHPFCNHKFIDFQHDYRYAYDTDKEMMILKMVDLVTGNGRGMIELVQLPICILLLL